jgi:hypothetical protein
LYYGDKYRPFLHQNPVFNAVGRHNIADLFLRLAFGETVTINDDERFTDICTLETFLVRELDNEPSVFISEQIDQNYISIYSRLLIVKSQR